MDGERMCKWCSRNSRGTNLPKAQVNANGVMHYWSRWYMGKKEQRPWTLCGFEVGKGDSDE